MKAPSVVTVTQLNTYLKSVFDGDSNLTNIYLSGEISNFTNHYRSGHLYFSLKDEKCSVRAVMFSSSARRIRFTPQDGMKVLVRGRVSVYEASGQYQVYVDDMQPDGVGALNLAFEQLKRKLAAEGLFDASRKKPLPRYPARIGVATSPTGAVVRDILQILGRRWPAAEIIFCPVLVQGEGAAESIAEGLAKLDALGLDVIIAGRGGGSIEDLWAFNEETVARAIFACRTPVISAVGHETDTTIADFVADLRAPTPSAAAELAVADMNLALERLQAYRDQMGRLLEYRLSEYKMRLQQIRIQLEFKSPVQRIRELRQRAVDTEDALHRAMRLALEEKRHRMSVYIERMKGLSPLEKLGQGYAAVTDSTDRRVYCVGQVKPGDVLQIYVTDGRITATVDGTAALPVLEQQPSE